MARPTSWGPWGPTADINEKARDGCGTWVSKEETRSSRGRPCGSSQPLSPPAKAQKPAANTADLATRASLQPRSHKPGNELLVRLARPGAREGMESYFQGLLCWGDRPVAQGEGLSVVRRTNEVRKGKARSVYAHTRVCARVQDRAVWSEEHVCKPRLSRGSLGRRRGRGHGWWTAHVGPEPAALPASTPQAPASPPASTHPALTPRGLTHAAR